MEKINVAIITSSDSCWRNQSIDRSGPQLVELFTNCGFNVTLRKIVADEIEQIKEVLEEVADEFIADIAIVTGGTGLSKRDVTPEATEKVIERSTPSITTALIMGSLKKTPFAMLSRLTSGIRKKTLIVNFPGSVKACRECFDILLPVLKHAVAQLKDDLVQISAHHQDIQQEDNHMQKSHKYEKKIVTDMGAVTRDRRSPFSMQSIHHTMKIIIQQCLLFNQTNSSVLRLSVESALILNYYLVDDLFSKQDMPAFAASLKDGYAVCSSDVSSERQLVEVILAGDVPQVPLQPGFCSRISTGAPLPIGADAVVAVENTNIASLSNDGKDEKSIQILVKVAAGQDVRAPGTDAKSGDLILKAGSRITPVECALCASLGLTEIPVYSKPKIGIFSGGNELLQPGDKPQIGRVYNSNSTMLLQLLNSLKFNDVKNCGIIKDTSEDILLAFKKAFAEVDVIITSGGVSMGEKDLIKQVLTKELNAQIHVARVNVKPGKPFTFATLTMKKKTKMVFALPGNPVSAFVTFHLFVKPALNILSGMQIKCANEFDNELINQNENNKNNFDNLLFKMHPSLKVKVLNNKFEDKSHCCEDNRPEFVRAILSFTSSVPEAYLVEGNQCSSRLMSVKDANLLVMIEKSENQELKTAILI